MRDKPKYMYMYINRNIGLLTLTNNYLESSPLRRTSLQNAISTGAGFLAGERALIIQQQYMYMMYGT